jgi:AcrR family transcriptional regulator
LFSEQGYALTSMKAIAERSAVSVQTVHLTGLKADLLLEAFARRLNGVQPQRGASSFSPPQLLSECVRLAVDANSRTALLWHASKRPRTRGFEGPRFAAPGNRTSE